MLGRTHAADVGVRSVEAGGRRYFASGLGDVFRVRRRDTTCPPYETQEGTIGMIWVVIIGMEGASGPWG